MDYTNHTFDAERAALSQGSQGGGAPGGAPELLQGLLWGIAHRRSLGLSRFKPDDVNPKLIELMLEAANWAPSHRDTEPWRFCVFTGEGRGALADAFEQAYRYDIQESGEEFREDHLKAHRDRAFAAPVWIAIAVDPPHEPDGTPVTSEEEEVMAVSCAVHNLHLVASAAGLAGMWHSKGSSIHPAVGKALGWEAPARLLGMFHCGWPKVDWPAGERKPIAEKVRWFDGRE
ncbi:MAG: nitroreductase [Fimbriimonadaceae bacterium]|nr:nitroreductase [Fimbriimonadaceae bacterium]